MSHENFLPILHMKLTEITTSLYPLNIFVQHQIVSIFPPNQKPIRKKFYLSNSISQRGRIPCIWDVCIFHDILDIMSHEMTIPIANAWNNKDKSISQKCINKLLYPPNFPVSDSWFFTPQKMLPAQYFLPPFHPETIDDHKPYIRSRISTPKFLDSYHLAFQHLIYSYLQLYIFYPVTKIKITIGNYPI